MLTLRRRPPILSNLSAYQMLQNFAELYNHIQKTSMSSITQSDSSRRKYSRISIGRRAKLVGLITEENYTIAKAAKRLGIKASTARMILNKYKETGEFPMKQFKKGSKASPRKGPHSQSPLPPVALEEENVDPQAQIQVSQNLGSPVQSTEAAEGSGCNWMYFWVFPDYASYSYFIF